MCTALSFTTKDHYFGRNLDLDRSYGEEVCVMPRNFPIEFRTIGKMDNHFAMIGIATVVCAFPLFYDAANEYGLSMAGLNFTNNAFFGPIKSDKDNIAPFEFIPWVLSQCKTVNDAENLLSKINLAEIPFNDALPCAYLHWIISDKDRSIVAEFLKDGLHIHTDEYGVLTNNPPFPYHLENLEKYKNLRNDNKNIQLEENLPYSTYSQGLGAVGLPGDVSSMSRFVRMVFGKQNSVCDDDELSSVGQFFHLLSSVETLKGACVTDQGNLFFTVYSCCINTDKGRYYYTSYQNRQINCVDMHKTDLNGEEISRFPLELRESINLQN